MKKLMIAALAVASCTAVANAADDPSKDTMSKDAVYNLTFTTKYLDYATKAGPSDITAKENKDYYVSKGKEGVLRNKIIDLSPEAYYACYEKFNNATNDLQQSEEFKNLPLVISDYKETIKTYAIYGIGTNQQGRAVAVVVDQVPVVTKITFKYQDLSKKTKVVTKNMNGIVIRDNGKYTSYIWDNATKDFAGENVFAGSTKGKPVQLATASRSAGKNFMFSQQIVAKDKNTDGGFHWITGWEAGSPVANDGTTITTGWGTGTVKLNATQDNQVYVINSLAGNFAGVSKFGGVLANGEYGTWKLSYDDASTKILLCREDGYKGKGNAPTRKYDGVVYSDKNGVSIPESYEEILGKKKVEIIVD